MGAGTTLLHYRLSEKIGEGGMGLVWRATDIKPANVKLTPDGKVKLLDAAAGPSCPIDRGSSCSKLCQGKTRARNRWRS